MNLTDAVAAGLHDQWEAELADGVVTEHQDLLQRFPRQRWETMTKEEYALGLENSRDGYSYAIEFGTVRLGSISGGSAKKHRIFFRRNVGEWYYPSEFSSVDDAWEALRSSFQRLLDLAERGQWAETSNVDQLRTVHTVRLKTLYLYFSDQLLPCYSKDHLRYFARELGVEAGGDLVTVNRAILGRLRAEPGLETASGIALMRMLYQIAPPPGYVSDSYVKITAPDDATWDLWRRDGYASTGWGMVGDLTEFESQEDFARAFRAVYPQHKARKERISELWRLRELTAGTHVVAARGTSEVLGVGVVTEPGYAYQEWGEDSAHSVSVDWNRPLRKTLDKPIPGWGYRDVVDLKQNQVAAVLADVEGAQEELERVQDSVDPRFEEWARILERKKQIIFFGPPGTGKTYHAKRFLAWFLARKNGVDRDEDQKRLSEITFHANYSYEEFVEGYRPAPAAINGGLTLDLRPGLFKCIAEAAAERPDEHFALLIDEFNRANVPQVFGELLTVIEADKRGQSVQLPASGDDLAVPSNLYVVGTMNTADRSIRSLDTALRRRFGFVELMPDSNALNDSGLTDFDLVAFFGALNERITGLAGRERQIGHSLFMTEGKAIGDVDELVDVMRTDVIPLLQELVYDDYKQLEKYLGRGIVDADNRTLHRLDNDEFVEKLRQLYLEGAGES
ncbi:5-methylcytosine-specific restriction protein B [Rhodococcus sp. LBL1]|nr:5-methylcytosine-specific restriction protein B [Rhodococcus sp. LBL1]MDH6684683.1 5-methylcytosine-specific restriction protein B [Rhodococcus sp. LBL2]